MWIKSFVLILAIIFTWVKTHTDVHRFQLIGYFNGHYLKWVSEDIRRLVKPHESLYVIGILLVFLSGVTWLQLLGLLLIAIDFYFFHLIKTTYPQKKKLVYTPRVKRLLITDLIIVCSLGLAIGFMPSPFDMAGVMLVYIFSFLWLTLSNIINKPIESAVNNYYYNDAKRLLAKNPNMTVIGITGSYGKTSTKNVLHAMLSKDFNVLMTPESFNTKMGLTRTIREGLKPTHQIFIAEMGAKVVGEIRELMEFVHPTMGIITSIGPQHLETFKTFENIVSTKGEMFQYLESNGTAFVNVSDPNIVSLPKRDDLSYIYFSVEDELPENLEITPDYRIESIAMNNSGSSFTLVHTPTGKKVRLGTGLLGRHNLSNVVAGAAISLSLGVPMERLPSLTADLKPVEHRLSYRRVNDFYTILDDAFNSNPVGSKMALEVLAQFEGNKKIVITPGMIELGDRHFELNKAFGESIADVCDFVILVGQNQTKPIQDGLTSKHYDENKLYIAKNISDAFSKLSEIIELGDVVLLENDLPDTFNE
ncbi:MAG: UDP-N-acetylmuramoyl-tripeptide--D-alanyl-D-alanine ligase [Clostridia bacterium]|nr:UDP-N-acetylmuramoyl-tripeptide--D-alanyl-D-alanine ligase [Clostridia bacterium]